jgi:transaldolase
MSLQQAIDLIEVYDRAVRGLRKPPKVYLSHIAGIFDEYITDYVARHHVEIYKDLIWQVGKIVAKRIRSFMDDCQTDVGFINGGVRELSHFTEWVGADISTTINWKGTADILLEKDLPVVSRFDNPVPEVVIQELLDKLPDFKTAYFPGGIKSHEYEQFGPVVLFCSSFKDAWEKARENVRRLK